MAPFFNFALARICGQVAHATSRFQLASWQGIAYEPTSMRLSKH